MAKIVLALATSHGPMLVMPPDLWTGRVAADKANTHPFRGSRHSFDELVKLRAGENLAEQASLEQRKVRHARCQVALKKLREEWAAAKPDVAIVVGNDQNELFTEENLPAICIYWGEEIENVALTPEQRAKLPPGLSAAEEGHCPPEGARYPGCPELGCHLLASLSGEFDPAQSRRASATSGRRVGIPHAFGFVYRQIMRDQVVPNVPVILNTFFAPNQPSLVRCHALGKAIACAVATWKSDLKVAIVASGGLTHFVVDEDLDRQVLNALEWNDERAVAQLPLDRFESGTSEIRNWFPVGAAAGAAGLKLAWKEYVPCYRSEAGTGNAMGFICWRA